jgi:hypothetical protein
MFEAEPVVGNVPTTEERGRTPRADSASPWRGLRFGGMAVALMTAIGFLAVDAPSAAASQSFTPRFGYTASAFGTAVKVGKTVVSQQTSLCALGCTTRIGVHTSNSALSTSVTGVLSTSTVATQAATSAIASGSEVTATSTIQGVSVLLGVVQATTVEAASTTSETGTAAGDTAVSAAGSKFVGLSVLGKAISGTPAPNTKITLPGLGYVILNQQTGNAGAHSTGLQVTMIDVVVNQENSQGYAIGTHVRVAEAQTSIHSPVAAVLRGDAYATSVRVGSVVSSGRTALVGLGCFETGSHKNTTATVSIPVLTSATATDTARGDVTDTTARGTTRSTIENLNLLSGLVTATTIHSTARVVDNVGAVSTSGSATFVDLAVAGHPGISSTPAPNTQLTIAGLGTLWLNRVVQTSNSYGLAVGTVVRVGVASAGVTHAG